MKKHIGIVARLLACSIVGMMLVGCSNDGGTADGNYSIKKPVIYLYPEKDDTDVTVNIKFDGKLETVYPDFSIKSSDSKSGGWKVKADKDGTIHAYDREYNYLFWEGTYNVKGIQSGYCVAREDTKDFLEDSLAELGLTDKESADFITYWLPYMNKHKYNLISFNTTAYRQMSELNVTPKPDTIIRVFMTYKGVDKPVDLGIEPVDITPIRHGFTVVEWGGTEIN